jgi:hypothetical protein
MEIRFARMTASHGGQQRKSERLLLLALKLFAAINSRLSSQKTQAKPTW